MTKANRKKIAKELLDAAERIELGENIGCCGAIESNATRKYFQYIFRDDAQALPEHDVDLWFETEPEARLDVVSEEVVSRRVLGLCFAALMAEEGVF